MRSRRGGLGVARGLHGPLTPHSSPPNASVPVPQVRLAAFARAHVEVGQTVTVSLSVPPQSHAAVLDAVTGDAIYTAGSDVVVEAGAFELYCGGGQPDFVDDTLKTEIVVRGGSRLDAC